MIYWLNLVLLFGCGSKLDWISASNHLMGVYLGKLVMAEILDYYKDIDPLVC